MHIAVVCPELHGHLNPMTTLAAELVRRGHTLTLFGTPDAEAKALRMGLSFHPIGMAEHKAGTFEADKAKLASLTGFAALKFTGQLLKQAATIGIRDLPAAFGSTGVEAILVDQVSPAAACVGDVIALPYVIVCNAMAMHQEPGVPPGPTAWPYRTGFLGRLRNRLGNLMLKIAARPIYKELREYQIANGLQPRKQGINADYGLAQIAQQPAFFDFPRKHLPSHFHYTGPWHAEGRDVDVPFPWEQLNGKPLIYASLGTLQNRLADVFRAIVAGCAELDVQVVVSLGRNDAVWDGPTPANAIVVPFAPQLPLLDKASVVITHAGLNTVMESLARGKPMLCLPVTNDQPGVANRVRWLGAGGMLKPSKATPVRIREAVSTLMMDGRFRTVAEQCQKQMADGDGLRKAGDIAERALKSGKRVERE